MNKICTQCGFRNGPENRFCGKCGRPLQPAVESSATEIALPPVRPGPTMPYAQPVKVVKQPTVTAQVRFANGAVVQLSGSQDFFVGRTDPPGGWFPAIDMAAHGGEAGGVSRKHARLFFKDATAYVEDLGSTNGTFLNENRLPANMPRRVQNGDNLRFGRVQVSFTMNENPAAR